MKPSKNVKMRPPKPLSRSRSKSRRGQTKSHRPAKRKSRLTLKAFTSEQFKFAHALLASRVATMLGRKMEEDDWAAVYCQAKGIPKRGWSNLDIDVTHNGLGVEHKMMCVRKRQSIREYCGESLMHPAATRSIRVGALTRPPNAVARDVLTQYGQLIAQRREKVAKTCKNGAVPDMRTGWLLWQLDLDEFLYFEVVMQEPDPTKFTAEWNERPARGARKATKNLWIYEKSTGKKRFSVTTEAGAKIQPYFDIPSPQDSNLYYFRVQGEPIGAGGIRVWITPTTALCLKAALGTLDIPVIESAILKLPSEPLLKETSEPAAQSATAVPLVVKREVYRRLRLSFQGVSDEHLMQQFARYLFEKKPAITA